MPRWIRETVSYAAAVALVGLAVSQLCFAVVGNELFWVAGGQPAWIELQRNPLSFVFGAGFYVFTLVTLLGGMARRVFGVGPLTLGRALAISVGATVGGTAGMVLMPLLLQALS